MASEQAGVNASNDSRRIFPYPGLARSDVWAHFGFYKAENGELDMKKAICKICRKVYTNNGECWPARTVSGHREFTLKYYLLRLLNHDKRYKKHYV